MGDYLVAAQSGAPGVVIAHDWFGLLPEVEQLCDDLEAGGFSTLAVDFYDGRTAADTGEAASLMAALSAADAQEKLAAAVRRLRGAEGNAPRVGVVGFSIGGWLALQAATKGLFDAVVTYYAVLAPAETAPIPCPVLLHLAAADEWDPPDAPARFVAALQAEGTPVEAITYPGTAHSFANGFAAEFAPDATAEAWDATAAFLRRTVGA